jgi:hypothetical protein
VKLLPSELSIEIAHQGDWRQTSALAWSELANSLRECGVSYYGVIADSYPQIDNRISRYRKLRKRPSLQRFFSNVAICGDEIEIKTGRGVSFSDIVGLTKISGADLVDMSRSNRKSFVIVSDISKSACEIKETILDGYIFISEQNKHSVDDADCVNLFASHGLYALRTHGEFDDRSLNLTLITR